MIRENPLLACSTLVMAIAIIKLPGIINAWANLTKARALAEQAEQKRGRLAGRVTKAQIMLKDKKGG